MTLAILVEGTTDKKVIRVLLDKLAELRGSGQPVSFRVKSRSDLLQGPKVLSIIRYDLLNTVPDLAGVLVCVDMECDEPTQLAGRVAQAKEFIAAAGIRVRVEYHLVRFALESWLVADPAAWGRAFPFNLRAALPLAILDECDPKEAISSRCATFGFDFNATVHDVRVAERLEISEATRNSQNFRAFIEKV